MELSPDFAFQPLPALANEITQPFPQVASPLGPLAPLVGKWVARLFGEEPEQQIRQDLRKFKRVMETGE